MDYVLIALVALLTSGLTLFSGFGLGTILMPVFALFFPIPVAVAATAVVHLANNLFKLGLLGKAANWQVVARFGVPAALAAIFGASALIYFAGLPDLVSYDWLGRNFAVTPLKLIIGILIVGFAVLELSERLASVAVPRQYLPLGGVISGFFGGLSGNQGAFRAAFLIKSGLDKEAFVATSVVSAVIVDCVRLTVYGVSFLTVSFAALPVEVFGIVVTAMLAAFAGAYIGRRLLKKVTMRFVRIVVALSMICIGSGLAAGVI